MLHRAGPFDEVSLVKALKGYLPINGLELNQTFEVEYMDDDLHQVMIANFVWLNDQWIFIDVRER
jgi:hypothetical protein